MCGNFDFEGSRNGSDGITMELEFEFDPTQCGAGACTCHSMIYVQMIRITDQVTGNYVQPNCQQTARMITGHSNPNYNGWAIDRLAGHIWGFYGLNDNQTLDPDKGQEGNNAHPAILKDSPSGRNSIFEVVSVPVCRDGDDTCKNKLTGFYYWQFAVDSNGDVTGPSDRIADALCRDIFDAAVERWNSVASTQGKKPFPNFSRLP